MRRHCIDHSHDLCVLRRCDQGGFAHRESRSSACTDSVFADAESQHCCRRSAIFHRQGHVKRAGTCRWRDDHPFQQQRRGQRAFERVRSGRCKQRDLYREHIHRSHFDFRYYFGFVQRHDEDGNSDLAAVADARLGSIRLEKRYRGLGETKASSYFSALARGFNRSLLILSTIPALRSATSLTLYSADVPSTCATSDGVNLYSSVSHCAMFDVAPRNASSSDPASPIAMRCVADSTRGPGPRFPGITSTVNSTSIDVSRALPLSSPSPCMACPSPTYNSAPGTLTGR